MKFLATLHFTKQPPSVLHLIDVALVLVLLPHLSHLKFPMLVYLLLVGAVLLVKKEVSNGLYYLLLVFGLLSIVSSFYSDFNFSDFTKFALYLSFLNVLLIFAVTLQRMKGEVNFYLAFSPAMLLMLSFFLHNSVGMLVYMVFVLFVMMLLLIWHKMQTPLFSAFKMSATIFIFSLPIVGFLFMVFPRISFEKADYGFQDTLVKRSGHNGKMSLGSDALLVPSQQVIMEVYFDKPLTQNGPLYFRGTTLYVDHNDSFLELPKTELKPLIASRRATVEGEGISYNVTLYPHQHQWLYALDIPISYPQDAVLYDDYTLKRKKKVDKTYRYKLTSYPQFSMKASLSSSERKAALQVSLQRDPVTAKIAKGLHSEDDSKTLSNISSYFESQNLEYTLKPDLLDKSHPIDSFLQGSKKGYCVHFAAAFTYMARAAGLPTRVVTGFMVSNEEALRNYLVVREYSAHAWVEVYLKDKGWIRVETTSFAQRFSDDALESLSPSQMSETDRLLKAINLRLMYAKYVVETWILEYSRMKQMEILHQLLNNVQFLVQFALYSLLFLGSSLLLAFLVKAQLQVSGANSILHPLYKKVKKEGFVKKSHESVHDFLNELKSIYSDDQILELDKLYHELIYAKDYDKSKENTLKDKIGQLTSNALQTNISKNIDNNT